MRLSPDIRGAFRKLVKKNVAFSFIAQMFGTTRQTVYRWLRRGKHRGSETFKDKLRQPKESKVTAEVELSILTLKTTFKWDTARIQQGIYCLPSFFLRLFCLLMARSLRSNGNAGAVSIVLKRFFPSYPQDKGKVGRCIQNLKREFINHLRKFPGWLKGQVNEYGDWFNNLRFHRGVKAFPAELYECNVGKLTWHTSVGVSSARQAKKQYNELLEKMKGEYLPNKTEETK